MANNVDNHLKVTGNHACMAEFNRLFEDAVDECGLEYSKILPHWDNDDYPSRDWMHDNVGPKWANVEDVGEDYVFVVSAWSSIFPFTKTLAYHLMDFDPKVRIELTYIDEFVNFAGVAVWANGDWDVEEEDYQYFKDMWMQKHNIDPEDDDFDVWDYRDMVEGVIRQWGAEMVSWMEDGTEA